VTPQFALAGWLVPADEAGGDTFDYVVDRETLHMPITDAMGHGVAAAQLATLAVGSLRNSRRRGLDACLVLGVAPDVAYNLQHFQVRPGDRLALVTDGMSEREAAEAEIDKLLATLDHLDPREAVQVLTDAVLHVAGGAMRDDATVLILDWYSDTRA